MLDAGGPLEYPHPYTRLHINVTYAATLRDAGALRLYAPGDPMGVNSVVHYLGIGAEWWFNSSYL